MKSWLLALAAVAATFPAVAPAQSQAAMAVAQARGAGLVGERFDGYLGLAVDGGPMLRHQVASVNIRRRALYAQLSASRGVTVQEVGLTAACQLLGTVGVGERYLLSDNVWRVRASGQSAPVPDYCR
ncbi:MAG: YdbL family protein [Sphingomicrobium sp.]|nr:YdbL family protein [Sphingomonadales bacterium]